MRHLNFAVRNRNITQVAVAEAMHVEQGADSKLERRDDMYASTLRDYAQALGGELRMVAMFPDAGIQLHTLQEAQLR